MSVRGKKRRGNHPCRGGLDTVRGGGKYALVLSYTGARNKGGGNPPIPDDERKRNVFRIAGRGCRDGDFEPVVARGIGGRRAAGGKLAPIVKQLTAAEPSRE